MDSNCIIKGGQEICSPFLSPNFNDRYFSDENGFEEAKFVFVATNKIVEKVSKCNNLTIGELGFGTGLNLLAALNELIDNNIENCEISYFSVEKYLLMPAQIDEILKTQINNYSDYLEKYEKLFANIKHGFNSSVWKFGNIKVNFNLYFGDVLDFLKELNTPIDCWFLDGHSPEKNPEMWNEDVCKLLFEKSKTGTTLATFTASGFVKQNLRSAGFFVKRQKGFGVKRHKLFGEKQ